MQPVAAPIPPVTTDAHGAPDSRPSLDPDEIRQRLASLQGQVQESLQSQFGSTVDDLRQLRGILGDATGKLSQAFQLMVRQARDQGLLAEQVLAEHDSPAARQLHDLSGEVARGAVLVVQSLQFEDMATQLLQHVDRRITWLEEFAKDASLLHTAVRHDVVGMTYPEFLAVEEKLAELRLRLGAWDRKVVQQQSLDEGDIELF